MKTYRVLNLGAGVQSTAVYLMMAEGLIPPADVAIFADTQDEPEAVYNHLEWLKAQAGPEIMVRTVGSLGDNLLRGENSTGEKFVPVPFYTKDKKGNVGMGRRQCSKEYKTAVVERTIRREIVGIHPRGHWPINTVRAEQVIGISADEAGRASRIIKRMKATPYYSPQFPLIDQEILGHTGWTRGEAYRWAQPRCPHVIPRSACVYCPFRKDEEWLEIKKVPEDWKRAVEIDAAMRTPGVVMNREVDGVMYAHRSCVPLEEVEFKHQDQFNMFTTECEGMCGV